MNVSYQFPKFSPADNVSDGNVTDGKVSRVDEIHPEYLRSLDVFGVLWLTHLFNIV